MPIYEFYCETCHRLFNFLSKTVGTDERPACPKCGRQRLERQVSMFAAPSGQDATEEGDDMLPIDDTRMEAAVEALASEAEGINEEDPRAAAQLMRKFTDMTGMELGHGMQEALGRMEAGEDPEQVEAELGDVLENEDPFLMKKASAALRKHRGPSHDPNLYDL